MKKLLLLLVSAAFIAGCGSGENAVVQPDPTYDEAAETAMEQEEINTTH